MKINWRLPIAIAILVIISLWTIMFLQSTGSAVSAGPAISPTVLSITLLVTALIAIGPLLYIISSARAHMRKTAPSTAQDHAETTAAPIVAKVKSHPLPPLWR